MSKSVVDGDLRKPLSRGHIVLALFLSHLFEVILLFTVVLCPRAEQIKSDSIKHLWRLVLIIKGGAMCPFIILIFLDSLLFSPFFDIIFRYLFR